MSTGYILVNATKRERILFSHLPASSMRELVGNPVTAAVTTWYMLNNRGDQIAFVADTGEDWPFSMGSPNDISEYRDVTQEVVDQLIEAEILEDNGIAWRDDDEPMTIFERNLRNKWMD